MTPLDAMLTGPRPRLDGARNAGDPTPQNSGAGFDAVLGLLEKGERPAPATPPEAGTGPAAETASARADASPRSATLGALLAGAVPAGSVRPGDAALAALMERAAGRIPAPGPAANAPAGLGAAVPGAPATPAAPPPAARVTVAEPASPLAPPLAVPESLPTVPPTAPQLATLPSPASREASAAGSKREAAPHPALSGAVAEAPNPAPSPRIAAAVPDQDSAAPDPETAPDLAPADAAPLAAVPWPTRTDAAIPLPAPIAPPAAAGTPTAAMPSRASGFEVDTVASVVATRPAMTVIAQETHFAPVATPSLAARPAATATDGFSGHWIGCCAVGSRAGRCRPRSRRTCPCRSHAGRVAACRRDGAATEGRVGSRCRRGSGHGRYTPRPGPARGGGPRGRPLASGGRGRGIAAARDAAARIGR